MAIRLRAGFSPDASRVRKVALARAAALAVAGRSASGRIAMPLPSRLSASTVEAVHGAGICSVEKASTSTAARATSCSICRLPITLPQRALIAVCAASNEPRTVSMTASLASPAECQPAGNDNAASAG
ncbi:hypothetical protein [Nonomuraea sp. NPDC003201]